MIRLDRDLQIALAHYNAGIRRARDDDPEVFVHICPHDICTDQFTCSTCRGRARLDLKVATSVDECAHLLALLDRPAPPRGRPGEPIVHGTEAGYRTHRRKGEDCPDCRRAATAEDKRRKSRSA